MHWHAGDVGPIRATAPHYVETDLLGCVEVTSVFLSFFFFFLFLSLQNLIELMKLFKVYNIFLSTGKAWVQDGFSRW